MYEVNSNATYEEFKEKKESYCLPLDSLATDQEALELLNSVSKTMCFGDGLVDSINFNMLYLKLMQCKSSNKEGPVYNTIALELLALKYHGKDLSEEDYQILERAIFWSELGKANAAKPSTQNFWPNGTPYIMVDDHEKKAVELLDPLTVQLSIHDGTTKLYYVVRWLLASSSIARNFNRAVEKDKNGDWVPFGISKKLLGDYFDDSEIPQSIPLSENTYNWNKRMYTLLLIKQKCVEDGRISDFCF